MREPSFTYDLNKVVSRPYRDDDLPRLQSFVSLAAVGAQNPLFYLHPGDLAWRLNRSLSFDPARYIHLWETQQGETLGFAWFYSSHNGVDLQVHPGWRGRGIGTRMVRWAESIARRELPNRGRGDTLRFSCFEQDQQRRKTLINQGYRPDHFHYVHFQQKLTKEPPTPSIPTGFTIRPMTPDDATARATLHDAAFFATEVSGDSITRVMDAPGYRSDLDLVAVAPDGRLAAFALCWHDPINLSGLFEPVGVHPDFRRLGLAQALLAAGLHHLWKIGTGRVRVYTESPNLPAQRLYVQAGFKVAGRVFDFVKAL